MFFLNLKKISIIIFIIISLLIPNFSFAGVSAYDSVANTAYMINSVPQVVIDKAYDVFDVTDDKILLVFGHKWVDNIYRACLIDKGVYDKLYINTNSNGYSYLFCTNYFSFLHFDITCVDEIITEVSSVSDYGYVYGNTGVMHLHSDDIDGVRHIELYFPDKIYTGENHDEVFFWGTPQGRLAPIMSQVEMKTVLLEIIKVLPMILVVVVSFLGLRKALRMLSTLLRRC